MPETPKPTLRPAAPEDADEVAEIWRLGWLDGHEGLVPQELVDARTDESFRTRAAGRVADTTVAVVDDEIAGFVMVVGDEVEQVYVSAQHRGTGVAGALLDAAERQVQANGHAEAWLARRRWQFAGASVLRAQRLAGRRALRVRRSHSRRSGRRALPPVHEAT
jgi:GNAT superfamily N-acetyltransferase